MLTWACDFGRYVPLDESAAEEIPGLENGSGYRSSIERYVNLAADNMRMQNPEIAARIIATHLGHGTIEAGEEYSVECENEAVGRAWQKDRQRIPKAGCGQN
ncbi:hypothetical protein [Roseovarius nanhaiticus]|jgi:hypothetical protein|uniref:hypothetical protein n=1 Tax=Roseovarius nanhaiticus TaxID=573024 RepID=UPI002491106D|nr:hypothetical protein [Roseovarius nanhaiticus]